MAVLSRTHDALKSSGAYPLLAGSALALTLLLIRIAVTRTTTYGFLSWNLFLAWAPFACALGCARASGRVRWLLAGAWLAFFPNGPYLLTDLVHFRRLHGAAWWYDLAMLLLFAGVGLQIALASLRRMHALVERRHGVRAGWGFVAAAAGLSGIGVYIGRFLRWNSWDVLVNPHGLAADLARQAADPSSHLTLVGVSGLFGALLLWSYLAMRPPAASP